MSKVFLDTNILVYAIDKGDPDKRDTARRMLRALKHQSNGVISTQVLQEFYVVATRKLLLKPRVAKQFLHHWSNYDIVTVTPALIEEAIECSVADQLSFWDALIVAAAEDAACDTLWTEDLEPGRTVRGVQIVNPLAVSS